MEETYVRMMLAGEADALDRCGVKGLSEHVGDGAAEVTVVAVPKRRGVHLRGGAVWRDDTESHG
jgi:hypothetical protein